MKHVVSIYKIKNGYIAKCNDLNITSVGMNLTEVKINFVQALVIYSKDHNTFIDFTWEIK